MENDDLVPGLPEPENKRFYPALDGLRAMAVLMVFFQHYVSSIVNTQHSSSHLWQGLKALLSWGWTGVDFFFVLSGFLITGILYDTRHTAHRFRNFYVRRTLRIFPLFYGVLLIGLLLNPIFHWVWHPGWFLWPFYLGNYVRFLWLPEFLQDTGALEHLRSGLPFQSPFLLLLGHFWSLCVEEQFYLVWPFVVFLVKDRVRLRNICVAVCFLSLAARIACVFLVPKAYLDAELLNRLTPLRADALLLGGLIALMLRGPEGKWLRRISRPVFALFVTGFIAFEGVYLLYAHKVYQPRTGAPVLGTLGLTLIDLFAGLLILLSLDPTSRVYRIFTLRPLRRLGQMSYGFYVFHDIPHYAYRQLVYNTAGYVRGSTILIALVGFCGTLILSYLSFRFYESPFLRLKDRFTV